MAVKLSGALPDEERSGMDRLKGALLRDPDRRHVVVMIVDSASETVNHRKEGARTPTAGIQFIEPLSDRDDVTAVLDVLARVRAERLNEATLDFDFGIEDPLAEQVRKMHEAGVTFDVRTARGVFVSDENGGVTGVDS